MTILLTDGFETYGDNSTSAANLKTRIDNTDRVVHIEAGSSAAGDLSVVNDFDTVGKALEFPTLNSNSSQFVLYQWPAAYQVNGSSTTDEFVVGFRFYNGELDSNSASAFTRTIWHNTVQSGTLASRIYTTSDSGNQDLIFEPDSGTIETAAGVLTVNTWHYIEIRYLAKQTTGTMIIYIDGAEVMNVTDKSVITFNFFAQHGFQIGSGISVSASNDGPNAQPMIIDDMYAMVIDGVDHTEQLGPSRVMLLSPASDATPNDWTPNSGAVNYDRVNGLDWDTSTYVEAATTGNDDHYGLSTLTPQDAVHSVQVDCVCDAVDGTPNLHLGLDDGTSDEIDVGVIGTGTTVNKRALFPRDPSGLVWTVSSVNSIEATQRMTE